MPAWSFVRHGESESNAAGWMAGHLDPALTLRGRNQAQALREQLEGMAFERVLVSDLRRALQTAEMIVRGRNVPVLSTAGLRERSGGAWEGRSFQDLADSKDNLTLRAWEGRPPLGESLRDVALRALRCLADHDDGRAHLVVAHGALIRAVFYIVRSRPASDFETWRPENCELVACEVPVGGWLELLANVP